jgi:hypothetical protein
MEQQLLRFSSTSRRILGSVVQSTLIRATNERFSFQKGLRCFQTGIKRLALTVEEAFT